MRLWQWESTRIVRLAPGVRLHECGGATLALSEATCIRLDQYPARAVLRAITQNITIADLEEKTGIRGPFLAHIVSELVKSGIIKVTDGNTNLDESIAAFWSTLGQIPKNLKVDIFEYGSGLTDDPRQIARFHEESCLSERLRLVITDDYLKREIANLDPCNCPTLLVRPIGRRFLIGPLFGYRNSICYDCFSFFLRLHRWRQTQICEQFPPEPVSAALPSSRMMATAMIVSAIERFSSGDVPEDLMRGVYAVDSWKYEIETIPFLSRLDCRICSSVVQRSVENRVQVLSHPMSGIVESVKNVKIPNAGLFVSLGAVLLPEIVGYERGGSLVSASGTGISAQVSSHKMTMEAVERFSAFFDGSESVFAAKISDVQEIELSDLFLYSQAQYNSSSTSALLDRVPEPLRRDDVIIWTSAQNLLNNNQVAVPAGYAYLNYLFADEPYYYFADTNGCAAADRINTAIMHGIQEIIERDALAIWWYNQIPRPQVRFSKGEPSIIEAARLELASHGRGLTFFYITNDIDLPVVAAISADAEGGRIYVGAAADLSLAQACERAMMELFSFWYWDKYNNRIPSTRRYWIENGNYSSFPFLQPASIFIQTDEFDLERKFKNIEELLILLSQHQLNPLFINLSRPALGVPAVKIIIPGLRHHGRRLAPGRLFDIPVELAWRKEPITEKECNLFPVPL